MTMSCSRSWVALLLTSTLAMVGMASGCARPNALQKPTVDVAAQRAQRRQQATRQFENQRDMAQYHAAMERWNAGDRHTCEAQLRGLVSRNPKHLEARRALADLALDQGDMLRAESELREVLALAPEDAQTHHSLGLLLESANRSGEAQQHLAKAAELAPDNTLFLLCLQNHEQGPAPVQVAAQPR